LRIYAAFLVHQNKQSFILIEIGVFGCLNWQASSTEWLEMSHVWGANWCFNGGPLEGPFSVKVTTLSTGRTLSARDVIPKNWSPKATYSSRLKFLS